MVPRAVAGLRQRFPDLALDVNILRLEEAIDYLLLGRGEVVAMSSRLDHPLVSFEPLATGRLLCIVPEASRLAGRKLISPAEMAQHPLIGIDPKDPYGAIMAGMFAQAGADYTVTIKARFGTTVCSLVAAGLGIAIIDEFTVAHGKVPGVATVEIDAASEFRTYAARRSDVPLSAFAESFVELLRAEMAGAGRQTPQTRKP
jgi:DNA-binding transcriptional LysR family regulator